MGLQVGEPALHGLGVGRVQLLLVHAAVHLEGADGGHNHDGIRGQAGLAALDVQELLGAQVEGEACFRDRVVAVGQGHLGGDHGVATVRDVRERPAVHEGRHPLQALHQVGHDGITQNGQQRIRHTQLAGVHCFVVSGKADDDVVDAAAQVLHVLGQAEAGHNLGGGGDVEALLAGHALLVQAHDDVAQGAVVHVHHALPGHLVLVQARGAEVQGVVDDGGEQVVSRRDGREIAVEAQIDHLTGGDAGGAAARRAALAPEHRAHGGLAQGQCGLLADGLQTLCQADGYRCLALARRGRGQRAHQNQLAALAAGGSRL